MIIAPTIELHRAALPSGAEVVDGPCAPQPLTSRPQAWGQAQAARFIDAVEGARQKRIRSTWMKQIAERPANRETLSCRRSSGRGLSSRWPCGWFGRLAAPPLEKGEARDVSRARSLRRRGDRRGVGLRAPAESLAVWLIGRMLLAAATPPPIDFLGGGSWRRTVAFLLASAPLPPRRSPARPAWRSATVLPTTARTSCSLRLMAVDARHGLSLCRAGAQGHRP